MSWCDVQSTLTEDADWEDVIENENEQDEEDAIELQELNKYQDATSSCALPLLTVLTRHSRLTLAASSSFTGVQKR